jgi:hypothetical protein
MRRSLPTWGQSVTGEKKCKKCVNQIREAWFSVYWNHIFEVYSVFLQLIFRLIKKIGFLSRHHVKESLMCVEDRWRWTDWARGFSPPLPTGYNRNKLKPTATGLCAQTNLQCSASPGISNFGHLKCRIKGKKGTGARDVVFLFLNRDSVAAGLALSVLRIRKVMKGPGVDPRQEQEIFSSKHPDRFWGPPNLLLNRCWGSCPSR